MPLYHLPGRRMAVEGGTAWARTLGGAAFFLGPAAWLMGAVERRGSSRRHELERWWARRVASYLDIQFEIDGIDNVDPDGRYVVAPLHEGFADALALLRLPLDLRFVARDELFEWRVLGRYLRDSDQVLVPRHATGATYRRLLRDAGRVIGDGESLVLFPQGAILGIEAAFHQGAFAAADHLGVELLPVVLTGSHRVWEYPFSPRLRYGQRISMRVLQPLPEGQALKLARQVEKEVKSAALQPAMAPPRRFRPEEDGYWDDYPYEIDSDFAEVASQVAKHRAGV